MLRQSAVYPVCPQTLGVHEVIFISAGQTHLPRPDRVYPNNLRRYPLLFVQTPCDYIESPCAMFTALYVRIHLAMRGTSLGYTGYTGYMDIRITWSRYVLDVPQRVPQPVPQAPRRHSLAVERPRRSSTAGPAVELLDSASRRDGSASKIWRLAANWVSKIWTMLTICDRARLQTGHRGGTCPAALPALPLVFTRSSLKGRLTPGRVRLVEEGRDVPVRL